MFMVIAEQRLGKLRQVTAEALAAVKMVGDEGDTVVCVLLGYELDSVADELTLHGIGKLYTIDHPDLEHYHPEAYFAALKPLIDQLQPDGVLLGHTAIGKDLAPMISAYLDCGQISDVIAIERLESERELASLAFKRPIYAGKAFERKVFLRTPWVVTIRPNNIQPEAPEGQTVGVGGSPDISAVRQAAAFQPPGNLRTVVREVARKTSGRMDLSEARVVVSGGRGVKSKEGFQPLEELAAVLGGAVGASRGACDAGYCDYALQIGQTGKVVTPEIYIACGISGAIQHLAGMSQSRIIIAINKDPEAPIFKAADYGIVGDLFEVVPLLTEEFRQLLQD